jgi:hypothetical protein
MTTGRTDELQNSETLTTYNMTTKNLKDLATRTKALFFQDSDDTIRIVYKVNDINYTELYFGSEEKGFKKYYN